MGSSTEDDLKYFLIELPDVHEEVRRRARFIRAKLTNKRHALIDHRDAGLAAEDLIKYIIIRSQPIYDRVGTKELEEIVTCIFGEYNLRKAHIAIDTFIRKYNNDDATSDHQ